MNEKLKVKMGSEIKRLRIENGLTQPELANKMGVSYKTISSWEIDRTQPSAQQAQLLGEILGCKIEGVKLFQTLVTKDELELLERIRENKELSLTDGEKQLIIELRDYKEIDSQKLEKMFNTILHYKQDNGTLKVDGVPSDHRVFMVTEENFLSNKKPSSSWASHARKDKPNGTNGSNYRYSKK